ncbi:MAG: hypothetical protein U0800_11475 [Isosphaeraceae bacterium]
MKSNSIQGEMRAIASGYAFPFLAAWSFVFLVIFLRSPDAYLNPFLYAEDGIVYTLRLSRDGLLTTLLEARPDYYVFGNILLQWLGMQLGEVFRGGNLIELPRVLAILSYGFFAGVAALPMLLLRGRVPMPVLALLVLVSAFVPLNEEDGEILGRISNIGQVGLYVALLLVIHRNFAAKEGQSCWPADLGLFACASTNPIVLALLPATVIPYLGSIRRREPWNRARILSIAPLAALALACMPLAMKVAASHQRLDAAPVKVGFRRMVELTISKNILYPLTHPFYRHLNTSWDLAILAALVAGILLLGRKRNAQVYLLGGFTLAIASAVLAKSRLDLLRWCGHHSDPYPIRYFLGQNLISLLILVVLGWDMASSPRLPKWAKALLLLLVPLALSDVTRQASFGHPPRAFGFADRGTLADQVARSVEAGLFTDASGEPNPGGDYIEIRTNPEVPPPEGWRFLLPRDLVVRSTLLMRGDPRFKGAIAALEAGDAPSDRVARHPSPRLE